MTYSERRRDPVLFSEGLIAAGASNRISTQQTIEIRSNLGTHNFGSWMVAYVGVIFVPGRQYGLQGIRGVFGSNLRLGIFEPAWCSSSLPAKPEWTATERMLNMTSTSFVLGVTHTLSLPSPN